MILLFNFYKCASQRCSYRSRFTRLHLRQTLGDLLWLKTIQILLIPLQIAGTHHLERVLSIRTNLKTGPKNLVAVHQSLQSSTQALRIQSTAYTQRCLSTKLFLALLDFPLTLLLGRELIAECFSHHG